MSDVQGRLERARAYVDTLGLTSEQRAEVKYRMDALAALSEGEGEREEVQRLRSALEWIGQKVWDGGDVDGGHWQDEMAKRGILVEVPAGERFREEYDCDTMFTFYWLATPREEGGEG